VLSPVSGLLTVMKDLVSIELCDGTPLTTAKLEGVVLASVARKSPKTMEGAGIEVSR
jgi:hypothetical protein